MAIPDCDLDTGYLPPGIHDATLSEIRQVLGFTPERRTLIAGLDWACRELWQAGVTDVCIDGSFVTQKPIPGDIDGYWVYHPGVDPVKIPAILLDFTRTVDLATGKPKFPMWHQYGIELFIHPWQTADGQTGFPQFFSQSRDGDPRGYIRVIPSE